MSADIFASLQTCIAPQLLPQVNMTLLPETADNQAGVFAALMDAVSEEGEVLEEEVSLPSVPEAVMTFTANNSFVRPIIEFLSGESAGPEIVQESEEALTPSPEAEDDDAVIWPEDEEIPEKASAHFELGPKVRELISRVKDYVSGKIQLPADEELAQLAEQVIRDENINELPEALREEIVQTVSEIASALRQEGGEDTHPAVKLLGAVADRIAPKVHEVPAKTDEDSESSEEQSETPEASAEFAGMVSLPSTPQQTELPDESSEQLRTPAPVKRRESASSQPAARQVSTPQPDSHVQPEDSPETPTAQDRPQSFREVLGSRTSEQDDSASDQPGSQDQPQSQGHSGSDSRDSASRPHTETRRTQTADTDSPTPARRTDSRPDFSAYFEGVLTSRRTASRTSPAPLDLRGTENFTQPSLVRNGITNVVRFIRADGVQKARVVVDPPALGRISVELTSGTSGVEASIKVSSEQIRQLVQDQLSQLRMNLSQQGVQVAEFTVDVQQDSTGQNQQGQDQRSPYMNYFADSEDDGETEEFRIDLEEGLLYWVA
ncbi:MAG: flagellar hook-length control protein FliK [Synergistaceae bacterium]|nr:flagellar hook-length control protein FliK [Synergistaceae bacterium]